MKKDNSTIIWGVAVILLGIVILGNTLSFWEISLFFKGWWTLFIIVPSIFGLFKKNEFTSSLIFLIIGSLLLLGARDIISWDQAGKLFLPIILIIVGFNIIFKSSKLQKRSNTNNVENYIGVFSGNEGKVTSEFKGCNAIAVFGGVELDLTKAKINSDIQIDTVSIFGGIDIFVPNDVNIKCTGVPIFGGLDNKSKNSNDNKYTITINYVSIFGGVDVK